jgi:hypothetical protein
MKLLRFIIILIPEIYSCSNTISDNSNYSDTTSTNKTVVAQSDTELVNINTSFPFGSAELRKYKYPHYWEENHDRYGPAKSPESKKLADISTLLSSINHAKTILPPKIKNFEYLDLNKKYKSDLYHFDTTAIKSLDSCVYRLPNFKNYQCYYYRQQTTRSNYGDYGSLLLLDPAIGTGKLLTLYFEYGGDQSVVLRYYFMDNDTIHLYDGYCYDDGTTLSESFKIFINPEGKIEAKEIKK